MLVEAIACATRSAAEASAQVGHAAIASAIAAAPTASSELRARIRPARSSPTSTTASTATAASAHAPNASPSAETPAASTSANGTARAGAAPSQRRCATVRAPSASSIDSAVISLTDANSSYAYTSAGRIAVRTASAAHAPVSRIRRASSHAGPPALASMNALNGWNAQIRGRPSRNALPPNSVSAPDG